MKEIISIQSELKAPKNRKNTFSNYNYRNTEDIQESLKPILLKYECFLNINDSIELIGDRYYVKAVATIYNKDGASISSTAYAREEEIKKGMDAPQITGATSSYARKYALNALLCIDDTADADATNTHDDKPKPSTTITQNQILDMERLIADANMAKDKFLKFAKIARLEDMLVMDFVKNKTAIANYKKKADEAKNENSKAQ